MSADRPIDVVLYWHMHQPEYRDIRTGHYHQPWTYLHVIKDYVDMVAHLEAQPAARAVVNFTPTLLEQIEDYARQINGYLDHGAQLLDPMLEALGQPVLPVMPEQRLDLVRLCVRANETRLVRRYPAYARLYDLAAYLGEHTDAGAYINDQFIADILTWFHLAWLGETVKRSDLRVRRLLDKATGYSLHDRHELLRIIADLCGDVIARYRRLAESGQVELSVTPFAHPIMPLLQDIGAAREALPDVQLPAVSAYPGGAARVDWHIEAGLQVFERSFGFRPVGCWPSEGSVSEATIEALDRHGFRWLASGETVLRNSLSTDATGCLHRAYNLRGGDAACFFRDDGLSDLIGFTYADWHAEDAVDNLVHHIENIAQACATQERPVISIIMDGENAWEYYPENGYHFLGALYRRLVEHPGIRLTTYRDYLDGEAAVQPLDRVVAGSWVYGNFSTWIGSPDKNRGWEMLCDAKQAYDRVLAEREFDAEMMAKLTTQLAICEGSDWFWWFGDYNPAESVSDFESLFRVQLANLYLLLGVEPPAYLADCFTHGSGHPSMGGTMRRGSEQ